MTQQNDFVRLHGTVELATAEASCWKCHKSTPVHALLVADLAEFEGGEETLRAETPTFVYDLGPDALPPVVRAKLAAMAPNYKPTFSRTVGETSWANVCVHCGMLQGAFFLHGEPDGPFFGGPEEFEGAKVVVSEKGFDVDGASYSV